MTPGQTNIKDSDVLPLRRDVLEQMSADAVVDIKFRLRETKTKLIGRPIHETNKIWPSVDWPLSRNDFVAGAVLYTTLQCFLQLF